MGCNQSTDAAELSQQAQNKKIDDELKRARDEAASTTKMLLLGAGESGKSTLVKQMRLMYANPYSQAEREGYREIVFVNALQSMAAVIQGFEIVSVPFPPALESTADFVLSFRGEATADPMTGDLNPEVRDAIVRMWADEGSKTVLSKSAMFQLNDSAQYFFEAMPRIGQPGYLPSDQDILRARVRSTGIVEEVFNINKQKLRVFDVGGQRSERKKWIHCFEGVSVLTFVAALSEYDQTLYEDESVNRLVESTTLWESIASSRWFEKSSFVLLLNKTDLFVAKVTSGTAPLSRYFSDYTGPDNDVAAASKYMSAKFVALGRKKERALYVHLTCATSTSQTRVIISAVMDTIMNRLLTEVGLM
ncbi:hypothetical protein JCM1841_005563 [Sporobolomyces salmonicolor]